MLNIIEKLNIFQKNKINQLDKQKTFKLYSANTVSSENYYYEIDLYLRYNFRGDYFHLTIELIHEDLITNEKHRFKIERQLNGVDIHKFKDSVKKVLSSDVCSVSYRCTNDPDFKIGIDERKVLTITMTSGFLSDYDIYSNSLDNKTILYKLYLTSDMHTHRTLGTVSSQLNLSDSIKSSMTAIGLYKFLDKQFN